MAATGTAPLVSAYRPATHPTSSQDKTLAVMPHVVLPAIKSSAANIDELEHPFDRQWLLMRW